MAILTIPENNLTINEVLEIKEYLATVGIEFEQWTPNHPLPENPTNDEILSAYEAEIENLKVRGGYVTADVINITPQTPGIEAMLAKFNREHWHDEDEVRFIIHGRGLFHIRPQDAPVVAIEVEAGDLLRVPRGTLHWFNLCAEREIRAIRLFQDPSGWTPNYTESGIDARYEPVCFGVAYLPIPNAS
ncbi:MAG: cupin domain-containing protein [Acidobacteriota bacterium]